MACDSTYKHGLRIHGAYLRMLEEEQARRAKETATEPAATQPARHERPEAPPVQDFEPASAA